MSLGLCVLVRDRQDSICVRFARAGLFCAGSPLLCRIAGPADFCQVHRILFFPFFRVFRSIMSVVRRGRGTRRACRTLQFDHAHTYRQWGIACMCATTGRAMPPLLPTHPCTGPCYQNAHPLSQGGNSWHDPCTSCQIQIKN